MENEYFLVKWIKETPIRFSIMQRSDFVKESDRRKSSNSLLASTIEFRWGKKICHGEIVKTGSKGDLEDELDSFKSTKPNTKGKRKAKKVNCVAYKKSSIDDVLELVTQKNDKDAEITNLKIELESQKKLMDELHDKSKELEAENESLRSTIQISHANVDIGNGVLMSQEFLNTIKATSGTVNIFGRTLFRKLFEMHEVQGYSLMGKGCNANHGEKLPSVDPGRRDAMIEYTLKCFGFVFASASYILAKKDLKRSLTSLIRKMNQEAREIEAEVASSQAQEIN